MTSVHKQNGVYVMEIKVKRDKEGQVLAISQNSETVVKRLGSDLI